MGLKIGGFFASLLSLAAVVATAILTDGLSLAYQMAATFAVSMIVSRIFAPNVPQSQQNNIRQQVPPDPTAGIPLVYGDAYTGGRFVDAVLTTDQSKMFYVMAISCISPNGQFSYDLTKFYYQDRLITFDSTDRTKVVSLTDQAGNVDTSISGHLYIACYISSATGTISGVNTASGPDVIMSTANGVPSGQQWVAGNRQMNGTAFAIVTLVYNANSAGTVSLQPITFHVSHYLNSTGYAIPGDVWYDYLTNTVYGGAVPTSQVDSASATALNAYSNELISYTDYNGATQTIPRYRFNGVLDTGQTILNNVDIMMTCCDSWQAYNSATGLWSVVINKSISPTFSFDDTNIIGAIAVGALDITQQVNQVESKFNDATNRDQPGYVNLQTPSGLLYPNEPVNKYTVSYDLINSSVTAQYLANRVLEQNRQDLIVSFESTYAGIQVQAGDVVTVTNANYGWTNQQFRVTQVKEMAQPDGSLSASFQMNAYNPSVYATSNITQFQPTPNSGLANPQYFSTLVAPTVSSSSPSSTIPTFNVACTIPVSGQVTEVMLFYTTYASPTPTQWILWGSQTSSNSLPFSPSTTVTFTDVSLPSATYYFAYMVLNNNSASILSPMSTSFAWNPAGAVGPFVDISGYTGFTKTSTNVYTPSTATLSALTQNITSPTYAWTITGATPTSSTLASVTITPTAAATSVVAQLSVSGTNLTSPIVKSVTMPIVVQTNKYATANLYQWSTTTPTNPSGTSVYTWATGANSSYTGGGGWSTSPPANPGTPLLQLWVASTAVSDVSSATTTSVSWASGYSISNANQNGANGVQNARPTVYQWAATIPSGPTGTSTYTWSSSSFTPVPSGWSTTITTSPSAGYTLWAATVNLTDVATATTSTINWSTASILAAGYSGTNGSAGSSASVMYARIAGNPTPVAGTVTVSGNNVPTGTQASAVWGASFNVTWYSTDPNPSSNNSLYQSDGIYNGSTTTWSAPYISSLKVGTLSAITVNTGALTVQDTLTVSSTGNIQGGQTGYNTGTGFFLGYSSSTYKLSIGNTTTSFTWDGSAITVTGGVIQTGTSGARLVMGGPSYAQALIGYNTSGSVTMGFNANTGQVYASNYTGTPAASFDTVSNTPAVKGINTGSGTNNGCGIYGNSSGGFGGEFYGSTARGTLYIDPLPSLPSGILTGGMCVYNNHLYFCNGTSWVLVV